MTTRTARLIEREVTIRETVHELEIRTDDEVREGASVVEITRTLRSLTRRGPERVTRGGQVALLTDQRGAR